MKLIFLSIVFVSFYHQVAPQAMPAEPALERCYRCEGVAADDPDGCRKDFDYCTDQERCMLMKYRGLNGHMVYDAMCKKKSECLSYAAEERLCFIREQCEVLECCSENLCNYASGTWLRFDIKMIILVVVATMFVLFRR